MNTTFLARFFNKVREIVEAAETPFAKLAIFILPIMAPIVPASFTGMHMFQLLEELFDFGRPVSLGLAVIVGLVLEMLGYVGAIEFIHALLKKIRSGNDEFWYPAIVTGVAYVFYLIAMFMINVQLGRYFGTPSIVNSIIGLLSFITVPTGLLAANHLSQRSVSEEEYVLRQEKREDRLKAKALKAGINVFGFEAMHNQTQAAKAQKSDWRQLSEQEKHEVRHVLSAKDIMQKYGVGESTAFRWKSK